MFQPQEYLGQQMYVLTPPGRREPPPEGHAARRRSSRPDRELIFSPRVEALQAHLRRMSANGPTLRDRPVFQEALKTIPADGRVMFGFRTARGRSSSSSRRSRTATSAR